MANLVKAPQTIGSPVGFTTNNLRPYSYVLPLARILPRFVNLIRWNFVVIRQLGLSSFPPISGWYVLRFMLLSYSDPRLSLRIYVLDHRCIFHHRCWMAHETANRAVPYDKVLASFPHPRPRGCVHPHVIVLLHDQLAIPDAFRIQVRAFFTFLL